MYKQDCWYQGEALKVPTAFQGFWSSNNNKKFNEIEKYEKKISKI